MIVVIFFLIWQINLHRFKVEYQVEFVSTPRPSLYQINLVQTSTNYPEWNFGENQMLDGLISLLHVDKNLKIDFAHENYSGSLPKILWSLSGWTKFTIIRVLTTCKRSNFNILNEILKFHDNSIISSWILVHSKAKKQQHTPT